MVVACVAEPVRGAVQRWRTGWSSAQAHAARGACGRWSTACPARRRDELAELTRVVVDSTRASAPPLWLVTGDRLLLPGRAPRDGPRRATRSAGRAALAACRAALAPARCWPVTLRGATARRRGRHAPRRGRVDAGRDAAAGRPRRPRRAAGGQRPAHHRPGAPARARRRAGRRAAPLAAAGRAGPGRRAPPAGRDIHDGAQQELVALLSSSGCCSVRHGRLPGRTGRAGSECCCGRPGHPGGARRRRRAGCSPRRGCGCAREAADRARAGRLASSVDCDVRCGGQRWRAAVYFCCREALQNAAKHAQRTSASDRGHARMPGWSASPSSTTAWASTRSGPPAPGWPTWRACWRARRYGSRSSRRPARDDRVGCVPALSGGVPVSRMRLRR